MERINPTFLYDGDAFGMSQATIDRRSGLLFVSGQVAWDREHKVTSDTVEGQARQALDNLRIVLEEADSSINNLLMVRIYIRGEIGDHLEQIAPILREWLGEARPSVTGVGVASLATPETLVEIEATAALM